MPNFDGIWELRGIYDTTPTGFPLMRHRLTVDVNVIGIPAVGTDFTSIEVDTPDETALLSLSEISDSIGALWQACYPAAAHLSQFELWKIPEGTTDAVFISQYDVGLVGTNATASKPAGQATFTFRSLEGGVARFQLMESSFTGDTKESRPYAAAAATNIADYITTGDNTPPLRYFKARDNSAIFANVHFTQGQNEKLYRKRYRS